MSRAFDRVDGQACPRAGATPAASSASSSLVDVAYELVRGIADGQRADAIAHGRQVIDFERSTHTLLRAAACRRSSCPPTG